MRVMLKAVIFDLDGVLIDSVPAAQQAREEIFGARGVDMNLVEDPHNEQHKGSSLSSVIAAAQLSFPDAALNFDELATEQTALVYQHLKEARVAADPKLLELLINLRESAIACAIATSGLRKSVERKLNLLRIRQYFSIIVTADDVALHKPDPEAYERAISLLGVDAGECVVIEDSVVGAKAACLAGAKVVGFHKYNDHDGTMPYANSDVQDWDQVTLSTLQELASV